MENRHALHRKRLKARYVKEGINNFEMHQVLELLLFFGIPVKDTNGLAHDLLERFGSISNVFDAPLDELTKISGISEHTAILLKLIPDLTRIYLDDKNDVKGAFDSTEKVMSFFKPKFIGETDEVLYALFLDNRYKLVQFSEISKGSVNATPINMRKIMKICMINGATGVYLAHNHPNGLALPSSEDIHATQAIHNILSDVGVKLLDHYVFAEDGTCISVSQSADYKRVFGLYQKMSEDGFSEEIDFSEIEDIINTDT